jgi:NAD(P)-dependent dehydrogenase (short-subunit alcohol dehydrogenase family)
MKQPLVLITGASQGIGAAIAHVFARELPRCRLALVARSEKNLRTVARACAKLQSRGRESGAAGAAEIFPCDVTVESEVAALASAVGKRFGGRSLDVLINNAGVFRAAPFMETSVADFDAIVAANLRSVFLVSRAFAPAMAKRGSGDVFNMSSIAGLEAYPNGAAYCAAKFGLTGLSKVMRMELRQRGVRVCCVHPGATWSPSWSTSGVERGRIMPAEDVARAFFDVYRLGRRTVVEEIVLRPQWGDV